MSAERSARLVRRWVALYTHGLPAGVRQDRADEIESDLWSQQADAADAERRDRSLAGEIIVRLILGIPADLGWRLEQRGERRRAVTTTRSPGTFARIVSALMIIGGVVWASWPVPALLLMDRAWTGATGYFVMSSVAVGSLCLGFAAAAILFGNLDRLQGAPAFLGSIGAAGALLTLGGFYAGGMVLLPIGSAALFRDLARSGVVSARLARFHGAAGVLSAIPAFVLIASQGIAANAIPYVWLLIAMPAYAFSWVPIGWSLRDGAWMPEEPAADS